MKIMTFLFKMAFASFSFRLKTISTLTLSKISSIRYSIPNVSIYDSALANELGIPVTTSSIVDEDGMLLQRNARDNRLELTWGPRSTFKERPFSINLDALQKSRFKVQTHELVSKAIGKARVVVDMTAGLGRDSLVLAAASPDRVVFMFERNLVLFLLLKDALIRLENVDRDLAKRMVLHHLDSAMEIGQLQQFLCDNHETRAQEWAVYLDPMYPSSYTEKRTAQVKKETQVLHRLVTPFTTKFEEERDNCALFEVLSDFLRILNVN